MVFLRRGTLFESKASLNALLSTFPLNVSSLISSCFFSSRPFLPPEHANLSMCVDRTVHMGGPTASFKDTVCSFVTCTSISTVALVGGFSKVCSAVEGGAKSLELARECSVFLDSCFDASEAAEDRSDTAYECFRSPNLGDDICNGGKLSNKRDAAFTTVIFCSREERTWRSPALDATDSAIHEMPFTSGPEVPGGVVF